MAERTTPKKPAKFSVSGTIADVLTVAVLVIALFVGWKMLYIPWLLGGEQASDAVLVSQQLEQGEPAEPATVDGGIPFRPAPDDPYAQFGVLYIPSLGDGWMRPVTASVYGDALTSNIGHYPTTQAPGQVGNFALAGHRTGWGDPFIDLPQMSVGDRITMETVDGWYVYEYRSGAYVTPDSTSILQQVPGLPGVQANGDRVITLQTCNPPHQGGPELYIGYGHLADFIPRSAGAPADVLAIQAANND